MTAGDAPPHLAPGRFWPQAIPCRATQQILGDARRRCCLDVQAYGTDAGAWNGTRAVRGTSTPLPGCGAPETDQCAWRRFTADLGCASAVARVSLQARRPNLGERLLTLPAKTRRGRFGAGLRIPNRGQPSGCTGRRPSQSMAHAHAPIEGRLRGCRSTTWPNPSSPMPSSIRPDEPGSGIDVTVELKMLKFGRNG